MVALLFRLSTKNSRLVIHQGRVVSSAKAAVVSSTSPSPLSAAAATSPKSQLASLLQQQQHRNYDKNNYCAIKKAASPATTTNRSLQTVSNEKARRTIMSSSDSNNTSKQETKDVTIGDFCVSLASKTPTPGGGGGVAVVAAVGNACAQMSANYTQRKKDEETGAANVARTLLSDAQLGNVLDVIKIADDDAKAYAALQSTWKKYSGLSEEQIKNIQLEALRVPSDLVRLCYKQIKHIKEDFLPSCNPNIKSDAKVGIHILAGSARGAYQTVLVNTPTDELKLELQSLLKEITQIETDIL